MSKYDHIDFTAPQGVRENMRRGLALHKDDVTGDGLEPETVAWARRIASGEAVSPERARMGNRFFGRNERFADEPKDSPAWASWQLWGGAAGRAWFSSLVEQMNAADAAENEKSAKTATASPDTLTDTDRARWQETYDAVFAETGDDVKAELAAWGAVRKAYILRMAGKSAKADDGAVIGGWGMLFTDENELDLDDQFFDDETRLLLEYYQNAPLWMEHGQDARYGSMPIGKRASVQVYRRGVWVEHELDPEHPLYNETLKGIEDGAYSYSSDSISHYVRDGYDPDTGRLGVWPMAGWSLTETPAEPGLGAVTFKEFTASVKSARLTASGNDNVSAVTEGRGAKSMDEVITGLAEFFGIDANVDAVKSATADLIAKMNGMGNEEDMPEDEQKADAPDMAQLAAALGLPPEADAQMLAARLSELLAMLQPQSEEMAMESAGASVPVQAKSFNFAALSAATLAAAKAAPAIPSELPKYTGQKTAGVKVANVNLGAKAPGLADLVLGVVGKKSESAMKAMGYSIGSNGGYFLRQEVANEIIELFRAQTVVTQLGATVVPMAGIESLTYRKQLTGAQAGYRGEAQAITQSEPTFGVVNLQLKELVAATRVNRRLLKNSAENLEAMIRNDLQIAINLRGDKAALVGTGGIANDSYSTGAEPRGVRYTTNVTSTALGANGAVPAIEDFVDAWGRIEDANVPVSGSWGIAMSPRTKRTLENLVDTTGQLLDVARWSQGYKYLTTTQISNTETVGSSSDCSAVYLGAWEYLIIGLGQDVEINVSEEVYRTTGEIYIEAIMMHDCGVAQPDAFEVLTGVRA